jgi:hypothetical protein
VQRRSLLKLKRCHKEMKTTEDKFGTQRHVNKARNIYLLTHAFEHLLKDKMGAGARCSMRW